MQSNADNIIEVQNLKSILKQEKSRCSLTSPMCSEKEPKFVEASDGHYAACHLL